MEKLREHLVVSLGNPLLDIVATVDSEFLDKYNLRPDNAILAKDEHMSLYKDLVEKYNPDYIAGGSAQNTLRVCQWILQKPKIAAFFGCVGKDDYANILEKKATQDGLSVFYEYAVDAPTGTCAVLISNGHRSLCAHLAAANEFTVEHLQKPENRELWENARYFYITGFFLVINPAAVMQVAQHAYDSKSTFMLNLSASFVMQQFKEPLMAVMPYVKVLFGNVEEAKSFARAYDWETKDLKEIGLKLVALDKENCEGERIVIITQGPRPVLAFQGCAIKEYPVQRFTPEQIVDTTAAGDAFCGGFLAQYIQSKDLDVCIRCGIWAASQIIQHSGCTFEGKPSFREGQGSKIVYSSSLLKDELKAICVYLNIVHEILNLEIFQPTLHNIMAHQDDLDDMLLTDSFTELLNINIKILRTQQLVSSDCREILSSFSPDLLIMPSVAHELVITPPVSGQNCVNNSYPLAVRQEFIYMYIEKTVICK
ncbi:hypothetical protein GQX74_001271 [Glossina fuscipes]|nr:hypothetical protein GQX74_001271 [Glossina fuscipes]